MAKSKAKSEPSITSYEWLSPTDRRDLVRLMTKAGGRRTEFFYELFDELNSQFFSGGLPTPLIMSEITAYGKCIGSTRTGGELTIPYIRIHPALCDRTGKAVATSKDTDWNKWLYPHIAYTTMIHEMLHIAQKLPSLRDGVGETSHNATNWVQEANRLSEAWELPRCNRRWIMTRDGGTVKRLPDMDEPTADVVLESLTMPAVGTWPRGVAQIVHPDVAGWAESCVKRLNLPPF
jgi:hypothetical protein